MLNRCYFRPRRFFDIWNCRPQHRMKIYECKWLHIQAMVLNCGEFRYMASFYFAPLQRFHIHSDRRRHRRADEFLEKQKLRFQWRKFLSFWVSKLFFVFISFRRRSPLFSRRATPRFSRYTKNNNIFIFVFRYIRNVGNGWNVILI